MHFPELEDTDFWEREAWRSRAFSGVGVACFLKEDTMLPQSPPKATERTG